MKSILRPDQLGRKIPNTMADPGMGYGAAIAALPKI